VKRAEEMRNGVVPIIPRKNLADSAAYKTNLLPPPPLIGWFGIDGDGLRVRRSRDRRLPPVHFLRKEPRETNLG